MSAPYDKRLSELPLIGSSELAGAVFFLNAGGSKGILYNDLTIALQGVFSPISHTHDYSTLTNIPSTFTPSAHTHSYGSLTGIPASFPPDAHTHSYGSLTGIPATFTPSAHTHAWATDITGKPTTLAGYGITDGASVSIGVNPQTGTSYSPVLGDNGKLVTMNNASANTFLIPANLSVPFPVGARIDVAQYGAGITSIGITTDTLRSEGGNRKIKAQYVGVSLVKIATTEWLLFGALVA